MYPEELRRGVVGGDTVYLCVCAWKIDGSARSRLLYDLGLHPRKDVSELKNFAAPPPLVASVMELVALLFGSSTEWSAARNLVSENNFGKRYRDFDKEMGPVQSLPYTLRLHLKRKTTDFSFVQTAGSPPGVCGYEAEDRGQASPAQAHFLSYKAPKLSLDLQGSFGLSRCSELLHIFNS